MVKVCNRGGADSPIKGKLDIQMQMPKIGPLTHTMQKCPQYGLLQT